MILVYAGVASQDFSQLSHIGRLIHAHADLDLSRLLGRVEDVHVEIHLTMILRHRYRHAQKRIEGVRLPVTSRTGQTGAKLRLKHGVHEGVVTSYVIRQGLGGDDVIRSAKRVLRKEKETYEDEIRMC